MQESGGKLGYNEAMEQAEKLEGQRAAAPARQKRIEALLAKEGEAGLDKSIAHMRSQMEKEGTNKELISSLLKDYEAKKAELEAARGGGGCGWHQHGGLFSSLLLLSAAHHQRYHLLQH